MSHVTGRAAALPPSPFVYRSISGTVTGITRADASAPSYPSYTSDIRAVWQRSLGAGEPAPSYLSYTRHFRRVCHTSQDVVRSPSLLPLVYVRISEGVSEVTAEAPRSLTLSVPNTCHISRFAASGDQAHTVGRFCAPVRTAAPLPGPLLLHGLATRQRGRFPERTLSDQQAETCPNRG